MKRKTGLVMLIVADIFAAVLFIRTLVRYSNTLDEQVLLVFTALVIWGFALETSGE